MSPVVQAGNHIASTIVMLAVLIVGVGGVAFVVARMFGSTSRAKR